MNKDKDLDALLDRTAQEIQNQKLSDEAVAESTAKVWTKLQDSGASVLSEVTPGEPAARIHNCSDLQALIPEYMAGKLADSRRLLLEDHLNECVPCRRALRVAREGRRPAAATLARGSRVPWGWVGGLGTAAAALLIAVMAWTGTFDEFLPAPSGARAVVDSVDGTLFRVSDEGSLAIAPGTELWEGDEVRTARLSQAVIRLRDGSRVEMDERSEFSILENRAGRRLQLARGNIIVEAAEQKQGNLSVITDDVQVAVTGTVFTVNHGTRGSRVAVLEGEVAVTRLGKVETLRPGQQYASRQTLERVPLARQVAWSRRAPEHMKLVEQFNQLGRELQETFASPARTSSALLPLVPVDTAIYVAVPNLANSVGEAQQMFERRLEQSPELQQWWGEHGEEIQPHLEDLVARLQNLGGQLGEEVVIAVASPEQANAGPMLLAEVLNETALRAAIAAEVARIEAEAGHIPLHVVDDPGQVGGDLEGLFVMIRQGLLAASPSLERLQELAQLLASNSASPFVDTPFYARIAEAYENGINYLVAVDLNSLVLTASKQGVKDESERATFARLGILDARYLMIERRTAGQHTETRAELSFAQARRGVASWLAEPAPMGTLDFVSADAKVAAAFVVKDPELMVEDLFQLIQTTDSRGWQEIVEFQLEKGINIQQDFAAPLGGEIAFALDGPVLPEPSWKVILEVYDPARLQQTIEWVVEEINTRLSSEGEPRLELLAQPSGGRTFYSLVAPGRASELHYVFVDGYFVAAPDRTLLLNAIRFRQTGYTLLRSANFLERLPADHRNNFSALIYQDLGSLLQPLADGLAGAGEELPEEARAQLSQLAGQLQSSLFYAYAEPDRITLAGTGDNFSPFGFGGGLGSFMGVARLLQF